jgi:hypothetical protein
MKTDNGQVWVQIDPDLYNEADAVTLWTDKEIKCHDWDIAKLIMDSLQEIVDANYPNPYK